MGYFVVTFVIANYIEDSQENMLEFVGHREVVAAYVYVFVCRIDKMSDRMFWKYFEGM